MTSSPETLFPERFHELPEPVRREALGLVRRVLAYRGVMARPLYRAAARSLVAELSDLSADNGVEVEEYA